MDKENLSFKSIEQVSIAMAHNHVSSLDLTELMLDRIQRYDPVLHSFAVVMTEAALDQARRADDERARGITRSLLHGVPIAVKDLCDIKDVPTAAGMPIRREARAQCDGTVVKRLRDAGAVLLGKLAMTEGATFVHHPDVPRPINPWRSDLWPGVSSSGSAVATAAGLCFGNIASDTGGSVRFPSACTGLTGLKPGWGQVSRHGAVDNAPSWDTLGPMARSAADTAIMFDVIAGHDPHDPTSLRQEPPNSYTGLRGVGGVRGLKLGVDRAFGANVLPEVARLISDATKTLTELGAEIREITMPDTGPLFEYIVDLQLAELVAVHESTYPAQADQYGERLAEGLARGRSVKPIRLGKGLIERERFRGRFERLFDEIDILLMPVLRSGTPTWEEADAMIKSGFEAVMHFTGFVNASRAASLTLPCGQTTDGKPVGFQLIGRNGNEPTLLQAGHAYQQATSWHTLHPTIQ